MKKSLIIIMVASLLFVNFVTVPTNTVHANPVLKLVDKGAKTLINRFGYKMHTNKTAQDVSEILIHKMKKQGVYDEVMGGLETVATAESKLGWAKWVIPAGAVGAIATILHDMASNTGELEEVEGNSVPVSESLGLEGVNFNNDKIEGVEFPIVLENWADYGFYQLREGQSAYSFYYAYAPDILGISPVRMDYKAPLYIQNVEIQETYGTASGYGYKIKYNYEYNQGSTGNRVANVSAESLYNFLTLHNVTGIEIVEVPEMPEHGLSMPIIRPDIEFNEDLEVSIPNDEGMSKWFNNDEEIYLNRLREEPELTDPSKNSYVTYQPFYVENPSFNPDLTPSQDNPKYVSNPEHVPNSSPVGHTDLTGLPNFNPVTGKVENPVPGGGGNPSKPDDDGLNLDPLKDLGTAFTNKFPFSLPWDIKRGIEILSSPGVPPVFKLVLPTVDGTVDYEFSLPEKLISYVPFVRGSFIAIFLIGLIYSTRKLLGGSV